MALDKTTMKNSVKQLLADMMARDTDSTDEFAERLTSIVDAFVKSATVTVAAGIMVTTAGSATAQTGQTVSTGTGTIA